MRRWAYSYRHCGVPDDVIFTQALFQGRAGEPAAILSEMERDHLRARGRRSQSAKKPAARPSKIRRVIRPGS